MPAPSTPAPRPGAAVPADEAERLAVLHSFGVLDTAPEARFDELVRLAARVTGMPIALITLVDEQRQWFKAAVGTDLRHTPREAAFCAHALLQPDRPLVVPDATLDDRFADNPLVTGSLGVRAYAGTPLMGRDAQPLGTLCVLDTRPHDLDAETLAALETLGHQVVAQLEVARAERALAQARTALSRPAGRRPSAAPSDGLERALDRGELVVHYQPFWDVSVLGTALVARVSGAEALVRWRHPERGLLLPARFVPSMEAQGLASRLGEVVLEEAVGQLASWERAGLLPEGFRLHVNVAAQQLNEGRVGQAVHDVVARTGAPAGRLCLEVTESALLDAEAFTAEEAAALTASGVSLALDDFGTGYSSLSQLRSYPFSAIKVDQSFVSGLGRHRQDEVIVDAVVSMARGLGLVAVCEGVETPAQLDRVVEAGCRTVQGWLFGAAADADHWTQDLLHRGEEVLLRPRRPAGSPRPHAYEHPRLGPRLVR